MPELPEVETVRRGLLPWLEGVRLERVTLHRAGLRFPFPVDFAERLTGRTVRQVGRRAKYLLMGLDDGQVWLGHLGMSGKFIVKSRHTDGSRDDGSQKHNHVTIQTATATIAYHDPRRFGFMDLLLPEQVDSCPYLASLGPEPLGNRFHAGYLLGRASKSRMPLKVFLLDQTVVAGLGNIYVAESLFRAGLHPSRLANTLTEVEANRLVPAIRQTLEEAIVAGGSSLRDYQNPNGEYGCFQHAFQVYDRAGEACHRCSTPVQKMVQAGRSTFYCESCQR